MVFGSCFEKALVALIQGDACGASLFKEWGTYRDGKIEPVYIALCPGQERCKLRAPKIPKSRRKLCEELRLYCHLPWGCP
jgi:hypothetical protein